MATAKTIADYGGEKIDTKPVANATGELAADHYNRLAEDTAAMTRTSDRFTVSFATIAAAAPQAGVVSYNWTHFGQGASYYPTIAKTTTGTYTLTYAASYVDGLGVTTTTSHGPAHGQVAGSTFGKVQCTTTSATVIAAYVLDAAGALTDIGGGAVVTVWIR